MVDVNITNMHITLTPPEAGTHDFLIQTWDTLQNPITINL